MNLDLHHTENGSVLILDDVHTENVYQEILNDVLSLLEQNKLQAHDNIGTAKTDGDYSSLRKGIDLDGHFKDQRENFSYFKNHLNVMAKIAQQTQKLPFIFRAIEKTNYDASLLGVYGRNDQYRVHNDEALYTTIFFLCDEKKFNGGNLIFDEMNLEVEFKKNRLVFFPSWTYHHVSKVIYPESFIPKINEYRMSIATFYTIKF